jgi:hypothetical protein
MNNKKIKIKKKENPLPQKRRVRDPFPQPMAK